MNQRLSCSASSYQCDDELYAVQLLTDADPPTQRRVYELLQLDIRVAPDRSLDIHGSIPTDRPLTIDSEDSAEVPQHPCSYLPALTFRIRGPA